MVKNYEVNENQIKSLKNLQILLFPNAKSLNSHIIIEYPTMIDQ